MTSDGFRIVILELRMISDVPGMAGDVLGMMGEGLRIAILSPKIESLRLTLFCLSR
jgi:hypothetical protein